MATGQEVISLRRMVDEPTTATYSDAALSAIIDASSTLNAAAAQVWQEKAAAASTLVNVSESGSSRSMQQVHQNALSMARHYGDIVKEETFVGGNAPTTQGISRP